MKLYRNKIHHISEARSEYLPTLAEIHGRCFERGWSEDDLSSMLRGAGVVCFVAVLPGNQVQGPRGFIILRTLADQSEVLTIATDPKFRKRGVGKALMTHAIRQLQSERIGQLFLEVSDSNRVALKLYNSLKFQQVSVRKSYYSENRLIAGNHVSVKSNALVMQLELR